MQQVGATAACVPLCGLTNSEGDLCHNLSSPPPFVTSSKRKGGWRRESEEEAILVAPVCLFLPFRSLSQKDRGRRKRAGWFGEVKHPETRLCFLLSLCAKLLFEAGLLEAGVRLHTRTPDAKEELRLKPPKRCNSSWIIWSYQKLRLGFAGERKMSSERVPSKSEVMGWGPHQLSEYLKRVRPPRFNLHNYQQHFYQAFGERWAESYTFVGWRAKQSPPSHRGYIQTRRF